MIKKNNLLLISLNASRMALYTVEGIPILFLRKFIGIQRKKNPLPPKNHFKNLLRIVNKMFEDDAKNINNNVYSVKLIFPENPLIHYKRYIEIMKDSIFSSIRAKNNEYNIFSAGVNEDIESFPKYYRRNFHFQTDGYFSRKSAELYAHQTEILFKGTLGLARRLLMAPMIKYIKEQNRTLNILEIACGSGEGTHILLNSCQNIQLLATDFSKSYMEIAQEKNGMFSNVKFIKSDATHLENILDKFDIVYSIYLFHELPENERLNVIQSCHNVLKPGGMMLHIDSIQLDDEPELNWALLNFPQDFHEPFYMNYIKRPLEKLIENCHFTRIETEKQFLSKCVMSIR
ncbi:class I SAM-dependent methyltransferase [Silvanigrella aquatica]|uniref:Methyltransferase domain-containing protein n=1 Tax=Silvanigrella aquatica TaxID=1915309 RepID=A0A1L4D0F5_9BACT|nr:class I SAM-dependent methyltransferase [Silvanigrella aquatica]APJ03693.1 hypothetical protein AXG55_07150 [Silvanigrella aquatica]